MLVFLEANDFRNFSHFSLEPSSGFNLIYGLNGSGKSSILESVYFLASSRSFRTHLTAHIVQYQKNAATVFGKIADSNHVIFSVGVQKTRCGGIEAHINGKSSKTSAQLAKLLPTILINPDSYQLIHGGPMIRRQFLNWGVFHVEHSFISLWKNFQRCLKQRNTALRDGLLQKEIQLWDNEFVNLSQALDHIYSDYIEKFSLVVKEILLDLTHLTDVSFEYYSGWNKGVPLENLLKENHFKERQQGYTLYGPHRADIKMYFKGVAVQEVLSRGEQKLLIFALQLAQARLLDELAGIKVIYLIDDIAAELDATHRKKIIDFLVSLDAQVFLTCLDPKSLSLDLNKFTLFHVEQGKISAEHP